MDRMKVLMIDETPWALEPLIDRLEKKVELSVFENADSGFKCIENINPDVILLDILMPLTGNLKKEYYESDFDFQGSKGIYVLTRIKDKFPDIKVFCYTILSDIFTIKNIEKYNGYYICKADSSLEDFINQITA